MNHSIEFVQKKKMYILLLCDSGAIFKFFFQELSVVKTLIVKNK